MKENVRHFIDNIELSKEELLDIFELIRILKAADCDNVKFHMLEDVSIASIFEEPSTRTRVSFEVAMTDLGGHALYLKPGEIHFGSHEALRDTIAVLSRMTKGIVIRTTEHETVLRAAEAASVPVFNAMTYYIHPTQGVCDIFTMTEHLPPGKTLDDVKIAFVGDSSRFGIMAAEIGHITASLGLTYTIASPRKYSMGKEEIAKISARAKETGGTFRVIGDPFEAVSDADFIVPDVWWYYGYEDEKNDRYTAFFPDYQVNRDLMGHAPGTCKVLHCLPANRGVEITGEIMDDPDISIIFDEAENRLHTERALLVKYILPTLPRAADGQVKKHTDALNRFMAR
jgi:putrescine carbamoyltransferase